ncbi:caspase family protein [Thiorhodococcus minor]|uniref:Caspase family protein n=1 Tax=Thiorhodococcus minor TaxID=57489 RepID=A0A6M0JY87_9GAMM|nr:caspase family protein [Thiorhodococcus minor]NEV61613.1 caspase family protein [Thiorhodococcus minor]
MNRLRCTILAHVLAITLVSANTSASDEAAQVYAPGNKFALVIGNSRYRSLPLENPANDAQAIAASLENVGFSVTHRENLERAEMMREITMFGSKLEEGDIGVYYYAGHAVQYNGENFLLPIGSIREVKTAADLQRTAVSMQHILDSMAYNGGSANVLVLDSCRSSPFTQLADIQSGLSRGQGVRKAESAGGGSTAPTESSASAQRSVVRFNREQRLQESAGGVLIAYATSPNNVALDGDGDNSPYTRALLRHLETPNTTLEDILKRTRNDVVRDTEGAQTPWYESSIEKEVFPSGKGTIEFAALLKHFVEYKEDYERKNNLSIGWNRGSERGFPIAWAHKDVLSPSHANYTKSLPDEFQYSDSLLLTANEKARKRFGVSLLRAGKVVLTNKGIPTGWRLEERDTPVAWKIVLGGSRCCPRVIQIAVSAVVEKPRIPGEHIVYSKRLCDGVGGGDGYEVNIYKLKMPDARPVWVTTNLHKGGNDPTTDIAYHVFFGEPNTEELSLLLEECRELNQIKRQLELSQLFEQGDWQDVPGTEWEGISDSIEMNGISKRGERYTFDALSGMQYSRIELDCSDRNYRVLREHASNDDGGIFFEPVENATWQDSSENVMHYYARMLCD